MGWKKPVRPWGTRRRSFRPRRRPFRRIKRLHTWLAVAFLLWAAWAFHFYMAHVRDEAEPLSPTAEKRGDAYTPEQEQAVDDQTTENKITGNGDIACRNPYIIDGDTFNCDGYRIRLQNIDAPEMPGHCRPGRRCTKGNPHASRNHLIKLTRGTVSCTVSGTDTYGRKLATCRAKGKDLSCEMVDAGHAVQRYSALNCP